MPTAVVVNDEPDQLELIATILEQHGWETVPCLSAQEALDVLLAEGPADILLTDLIMPNIDGWQLCQLLRSPERAELQEMPILVCSSAVAPFMGRQLSQRLGANGFLATPVNPTTLVATVEQIVNGEERKEETRAALIGSLPSQLNSFSTLSVTSHTWESLDPHQLEVVLVVKPEHRVKVREQLRELKKPGSLHVALILTDQLNPRESLGWFTSGADAVLPLDVEPEKFLTTVRDCQRQRAILRLKELEVERGLKAQMERETKESLLKWVLDSDS